MTPTPVALREPRFRRLWLAQAVSQTGDGLTSLALFVTIYRLSGSPAALGALAALMALPQLAFGLFAGAWVDRWDRRRTMVACDLVRAPLVAGLAFVRGPHELPLALALATLQSVAGVLFEPARNALTPSLVPREALVSANSLAQSTRVATGALGAAAAGVLLARPHGAQWAFGLDALSFAAAAAWTAGLPGTYRARRDSDVPRGMLHEIGEGLRVLGSDRRLLGVLLAFAVALLGIGTVNVLFVPFLVGTLRASTAALGMVRAAQIAGMVAMGALLSGPGARLSAGTLVTGGMLLLAAGLAALAAAPGLPALFAGLLVTGLASMMLQSGSNAYLQAAVPDALRGRVESTLDTLLMVALTAAMAVSGAAGQRLGMRRAFAVAAACAALGGAIARALLGARAADASSVLTPPVHGDTVATVGDVGRHFAGDHPDRPSPPVPSEELRG